MALTDESLSGLGFAGDWHANTRWAIHAIRYAQELGITTLVHLGDFAYLFDHDYLDTLQAVCERAGITLLAVRGNHDSTEVIRALEPNDQGLLPLSENVAMLPDGHRFEHNDISLVALGGAGSIDRSRRTPGRSWWEDELLDPAVVDELKGTCDIVVSHDCPDQVDLPLNPGMGAFYESIDPGVLSYCDSNRVVLGRAVDALRPALVVHGHYHFTSSLMRPLPRRSEGGSGMGRVETLVECLDMDGTELHLNVKTAREIVTRGQGARLVVRGPARGR